LTVLPERPTLLVFCEPFHKPITTKEMRVQRRARTWAAGIVGVISLLTVSAAAQTPTRTHTIAHYALGPTTLYVSVIWFHELLGLSIEAVEASRSVDVLLSAGQATAWADTTDRRMTEAHSVAQDAHTATDGPTFSDLNNATIRASSDESTAGKTISLHFATAHDSTVVAVELTPAQLATVTNSIRDAAATATIMEGISVSPAAADQAFTRPTHLTYFEFNVERPARQANKHDRPTYPEPLRDVGTRGSVRAQFVVDSLGRADTNSIKILTSSDPEMASAVRAFLANVVYKPAMVGGHPVYQLVEESYDFEP